jgi:outer membrane protein insertion porin family
MAQLRRNRHCLKFFWLTVILCFICGCNAVKRLKPGEQLYTGADIDVISADKINKKKLRKELERVLRPKPNQTVMGIRFKLWLYQVTGEEPKKGVKRWLKYKLGEKPVLYDPVIPLQVADIMANRLHNLGYFDARTTYTTNAQNNKVSISYSAHVSRPYTIASVDFPDAHDELSYKIKETEEGSLLKPGRQYNLDVIREERMRIDDKLKNEGYYYFNPDFLLFSADSTKGNKSVALRLELKPETPAKARARFRLADVYIFASYRMRDTMQMIRGDTALVSGYHYVVHDSVLKAAAVLRAIFLKPGDYYSRKSHTQTISRLMSMGVFHYVNIKFEDTVINGAGRLNTYIYLTRMPRRSVQLELQAVTKSNNYTGPAITGSYRNRNQFGNAELFVMNLNGNFETQFTGIQKGFNSYEIGGSGQLSFPKFITPFPLNNVSTNYVPRTKIDAGFRNLNRVLYFNMNAAQFDFGYMWKESARKDHELNPIAINFAKVKKSTAAFEELMENIPFLRRSFEEQFTIGGNYEFTYNSLVNNAHRNQFYFNGMLDLSGNSLYFLQSLIEGRRGSPEQPFRLFKFRYSQFSKLTLDGRYMFVFNKNSKLATRLIAGSGFAYLNSTTLPYIKQFFSGGSNSIRAFLPRTVGPGTYVSPDSAQRRGFLDQAGDIKLEANVEYRFTIVSVLKGALFLDGGNVWLRKRGSEQPGGEFLFSEFYRQIALGTGFGLRIDVTYFVLRFDLGVPLRKPYKPFGQRWTYNEIDFSNRDWRRQNLVLNIAIGYPF